VGWSSTGTLSLHWNGSSWTQIPAPSPGEESYLRDVDGTSNNDVWAVGYVTPDAESWTTLILHWDGAAWRKYPHPTSQFDQYFYGVAAVPGGEAWAVGSSLRSGPEVTYTQRFAAC
jgi:hypothetical protein